MVSSGKDVRLTNLVKSNPNLFGTISSVKFALDDDIDSFLRGYIKTWTFPLNIKSTRKINKEELLKIFEDVNILDYLDYKPSLKLLIVTRKD